MLPKYFSCVVLKILHGGPQVWKIVKQIKKIINLIVFQKKIVFINYYFFRYPTARHCSLKTISTKTEVTWDNCIQCCFDDDDLKDSLFLSNIIQGHIATGN